MSASAGRRRRLRQRQRSALRYVWRTHESVRSLYPVKSHWLDFTTLRERHGAR